MPSRGALETVDAIPMDDRSGREGAEQRRDMVVPREFGAAADAVGGVERKRGQEDDEDVGGAQYVGDDDQRYRPVGPAPRCNEGELSLGFLKNRHCGGAPDLVLFVRRLALARGALPPPLAASAEP